MLAKTNVIPTTVTNSTSENPCSALLLLRCILPPLRGDKSRPSRQEMCTKAAKRAITINCLLSVVYEVDLNRTQPWKRGNVTKRYRSLPRKGWGWLCRNEPPAAEK